MIHLFPRVRMIRTEVFDKYYFPAKWEQNEMEALIGFLKLQDPASKSGGGMRGGSLRGSGNSEKSKFGGSGRGGGKLGGRGRRRSTTASSWQAGEAALSGSGTSLSSSITSSFKDSAGKLSKLLVRL